MHFIQKLSGEEIVELVEVSDWLAWMAREIPRRRMSLPDEEGRVLVATRALRLVASLDQNLITESERSELIAVMILSQLDEEIAMFDSVAKGVAEPNLTGPAWSHPRVNRSRTTR